MNKTFLFFSIFGWKEDDNVLHVFPKNSTNFPVNYQGNLLENTLIRNFIESSVADPVPDFLVDSKSKLFACRLQ